MNGFAEYPQGLVGMFFLYIRVALFDLYARNNIFDAG